MELEWQEGGCTLPLGVRFLSKQGQPAQGTGICWAYDRGRDLLELRKQRRCPL